MLGSQKLHITWYEIFSFQIGKSWKKLDFAANTYVFTRSLRKLILFFLDEVPLNTLEVLGVSEYSC